MLMIFILGGKPFAIEHVKAQDLEAGTWKTSWVPAIEHPSIPPEQVEALSGFFTSSILLAVNDNQLHVSDDTWNRLLPDYKFTDINEFLTEAWRGKP